jgi:phthalate 4,5-cis-dihydrodiol dehydrogenase
MGQALRLGIAGCGNAGHAVLRDLGKFSGVTLGAVADVRKEAQESVRKKYPEVETFDSVEAMCRSRDVDALWIATPNELHASHVIAAAQHGKHIICEKPMALSLAECDAMIGAAASNGVKLLLHSKADDPPVVKMREVILSGRLGRVIQINTWNYKGWLKSARLPAEVDTSKGGGVVYRQAPHQVDIVRAIGGGLVKKVRAVAGRWNAQFNTEGNFTALLEFEDGTPATLVFNGYGFFDMTEMTWNIGEGGYVSSARDGAADGPAGAVEPAVRYAMPLRAEGRERRGERKQPFYGLTLVSCEKGDMRQSPDGLYIYTEKGREELFCPPFLDRGAQLLKLHEAITQNRSFITDGRWGKATLEVVLAILQSSKKRREITLSHQVPALA